MLYRAREWYSMINDPHLAVGSFLFNKIRYLLYKRLASVKTDG